MSSLPHRPVLQARRRHGRNFVPQKTNTEESVDSKRGLKRTFPEPSPQKCSANDRLKRLRTRLNEDVIRKQSVAASSSKTYTSILLRSQNLKRIANSDASGESSKKLRTFPEAVSTAPKPESAFFTFKFCVNEPNKPSGAGTTSFFSDPPDSEEMDWTQTEESANKDLQYTSTADKLDGKSSNLSQGKNEDLYVVTDTNVFISNLAIIKNIINLNVNGSCKPIVYVPWMVLEELDDFKGDPLRCNLKKNAQNAVKYINSILNEKNERIRGQSMDDFNKQKDTDKSQDNKIIACCLQVMEKYGSVILLSNDINLRNKALMNRIMTSSDQEIMRKIPSILNKFQKILNSMTYLCRDIIAKCTHEAYGSVWKHMNNSKLSTLPDCLDLLKKYWKGAFQSFLLKQSSKAISDLSDFLIEKDLNDDSEVLCELVRLCVRLCLYFKDVKESKDKVEKTIRYINQIKDS